MAGQAGRQWICNKQKAYGRCTWQTVNNSGWWVYHSCRVKCRQVLHQSLQIIGYRVSYVRSSADRSEVSRSCSAVIERTFYRYSHQLVLSRFVLYQWTVGGWEQIHPDFQSSISRNESEFYKLVSCVSLHSWRWQDLCGRLVWKQDPLLLNSELTDCKLLLDQVQHEISCPRRMCYIQDQHKLIVGQENQQIVPTIVQEKCKRHRRIASVSIFSILTPRKKRVPKT